MRSSWFYTRAAAGVLLLLHKYSHRVLSILHVCLSVCLHILDQFIYVYVQNTHFARRYTASNKTFCHPVLSTFAFASNSTAVVLMLCVASMHYESTKRKMGQWQRKTQTHTHAHSTSWTGYSDSCCSIRSLPQQRQRMPSNGVFTFA